MTTSTDQCTPLLNNVEMIAALRGYAPRASSVRHAKRLRSPSTLRRYRRVNRNLPIFCRPYSTELENAPPSENGPTVSDNVQSEGQTYSVVRGGFGDEDENTEQESRPARRGKSRSATGKSQWQGMRPVEPAKRWTANSETTSWETGQASQKKTELDAPQSWLSTLGDDQGEPITMPQNTFKRITPEDVLSLTTTTPWDLHKIGFLQRGFEFSDFRTARSFIIEAMQLKMNLNGGLSLSNFGRYVYIRVGTGKGANQKTQNSWSLSDEDVGLCWALQTAAKKYMGRRQMDAAAKPMGDIGYSQSWGITSRFVVPTGQRWHHMLDMRRPPISWLTMEYRELSQLGISTTEVVEALVNQIADDLLNMKNQKHDMAFPVWCVSEDTLAVSQTEFFQTLASITPPGKGSLKFRETVMLHRNFDLEQFDSMAAKERESLKTIRDSGRIAVMLKEVTRKWFSFTTEPKSSRNNLNTSNETVYLREWGPFLTKELEPNVYRVLAREDEEHDRKVKSIPRLYTKQAARQNLEDQSRAGKGIGQHSDNMQEEDPFAAVDEQQAELQSRKARKSGHRVPKGFGGLVHMLREKLDDDSRNQDLGRDPDEMLVRRSAVVRRPIRAIETEVTEDTKWRRQYMKLSKSIEARQGALQRNQDAKGDHWDSSLHKDLVRVLSKVGFGSEPIDWKARYYELRRSAQSLGILPAINPLWEAHDLARARERGDLKQLHWNPNQGYAKLAGGPRIVSHAAIGKYRGTPEEAAQHEDGPAPELDETQYSEVLESYENSKQQHNSTTLYYHWLPGEKFDLKKYEGLYGNMEQSWRPNAFKSFTTRKGMAPEPLVDSPPKKDATSPLKAPWRPDEHFVRPLQPWTDRIHWLPGEPFFVDEKGRLMRPPRKQNPEEYLEMKRKQLMEDPRSSPPRPPRPLPKHKLNAQERLDLRRQKAIESFAYGGAQDQAKKSESSKRGSFGTVRMLPSGSLGDESPFLASFGAETEVKSEAADFLLSAYNQGRDRPDVKPDRESTVMESKSSSEQQQQQQPPQADAETAPQPAQSELPPSVELKSENDGLINSTEAEALLTEVGIDLEKSESGDASAVDAVDWEERDAAAKGEGGSRESGEEQDKEEKAAAAESESGEGEKAKE